MRSEPDPTSIMLKRLRLLAILSLVASSLLSTQTHSAPQGEQVALSLRFTTTSENEENTLYFLSNQQWQEFHAQGLTITDAIDYIGPRTLNFYSQQPVAPDAPLPRPAATVTIPPGANEWLILFIPKPGTKGEYHLFPMVAGDKAFPAQTVLFVNLTPNMIAGAFGKNTAQVAPGNYTVIPYNEDNAKATSFRMRMAVREQQDDGWSLTYSATIPSRGNHRRWLVVYAGSEPQTLIYPDFVKQ